MTATRRRASQQDSAKIAPAPRTATPLVLPQRRTQPLEVQMVASAPAGQEKEVMLRTMEHIGNLTKAIRDTVRTEKEDSKKTEQHLAEIMKVNQQQLAVMEELLEFKRKKQKKGPEGNDEDEENEEDQEKEKTGQEKQDAEEAEQEEREENGNETSAANKEAPKQDLAAPTGDNQKGVDEMGETEQGALKIGEAATEENGSEGEMPKVPVKESGLKRK
ncbi:hypothetical protein KEM55_005682 [Ascosphaera atra]|nr:hypothetical protein KEM55_005682 [Ascosphaera atra]